MNTVGFKSINRRNSIMKVHAVLGSTETSQNDDGQSQQPKEKALIRADQQSSRGGSNSASGQRTEEVSGLEDCSDAY
jgi:hypothetical protein